MKLKSQKYFFGGIVFILLVDSPFLLHTGLLGWHWDWCIPSSSNGLKEMFSREFSLWNPTSLGSYVAFRYGSALPLSFFGVWGYLGISGELVAKGLILITQLGGFIGCFKLLRLIFNRDAKSSSDNIVLAAASIFYALSPYYFDQMIAGDLLSLVSIAIAPFIILSGFLALRSNNKNVILENKIILGLLFGLSFASSTQTALFTLVLLPVIILSELNQIKRFTKIIVLTCVIGFFENIFWLLPAIRSKFNLDAISSVTTSSIELIISQAQTHYHSILLALEGTAYFTPFYLLGMPRLFENIWQITMVWSVSMALIICFTLGNKLNYKNLRVICVAFIVGIAIAAPGSLIGKPIIYLYNFSFFALFFRTPQHLVFPMQVLTPILFTGAYLTWNENRKGIAHQSLRIVLTVTISIVLLTGFLISGSIKSYIGPHKISFGEQKVLKQIQKTTEFGRLIVLPGGLSEYIRADLPSPLALDAGIDANALWNRLSIISPGPQWTPNYQSRLLQGEIMNELSTYPEVACQQLSQLNVKFIELEPYYSPGSGPAIFDYSPNKLKKLLDETSCMHRVVNSDGFTLYKFDGLSSIANISRVQKKSNDYLAQALMPNSTVLSTFYPNSSVLGNGWNSGVPSFANSGMWGDLAPEQYVLNTNNSKNSLVIKIPDHLSMNYNFSVVITATGSNWNLKLNVNGRDLINHSKSNTEYGMVTIPMGAAYLPKSSNKITINGNCSNCQLGIFSVGLSPSKITKQCGNLHPIKLSHEYLKFTVNNNSSCTNAIVNLSVNSDPGWHAYQEMTNTAHSLKKLDLISQDMFVGVRAPAGVSTIIFKYELQKYYVIGWIISGFSILILTIILLMSRRNFKRISNKK